MKITKLKWDRYRLAHDDGEYIVTLGQPEAVELLAALQDALEPQDREFGAMRSGEWPRVRREHLEKFPECAVTGRTEDVEVHHIRPFHNHPELELDPQNLITLSPNTHLLFGHLGSFRSYNINVRKDAAEWKLRLSRRP